MKLSLRNCWLALVFALYTITLQHGALAQWKQTSGDTILVVYAGGTMPKMNDDPATTNRRFISFRDQLSVVDIIFETEQREFCPDFFKVEIIRGDEIIPLEVDLKQMRHHPSPPPADTFVKRGDVVIIRPKVNYW